MDAHLPRRDGREIAAEHGTETLRWLARFGWLTARQVARLVWPGASQSQRMAQRTLRRLTDGGTVLRRPLPTGGVAYVIGQRGVRQLRELGDETVSGRGFRDLKFKAPVHRAIANEVAIDHVREPALDVHTEAEIQRGIAPKLFLPFEGHERVPDLLVGQNGLYEWFEVEHAPKPRDRLDKLVALADYLLAPPPNEAIPTNLLMHGGEDAGVIFRFRFVCPSDATARSCWRAFQRYGLDHLVERYPHDLLIERVEISSGLVWGGTRWQASVFDLYRRFVGDDPEEADDPGATG